ncbi:MAG: hypothetical protein EP326_05250 [Deltaproteobacteria bacterium]|nr:MAG: hypothetical protein EP326_05250 [Deltaproteobacteria bacterium]TNF27003.1 MAG: hypothetical protein EP319_12625 [Deltaproteobacteria bacterium]
MYSRFVLAILFFLFAVSASVNHCLVQNLENKIIQEHLEKFSYSTTHHDNIDDPVHVHSHKHNEEGEEHHHNHSHTSVNHDHNLPSMSELYRIVMTYLKPLPEFVFITHNSSAYPSNLFRPPISLI